MRIYSSVFFPYNFIFQRYNIQLNFFVVWTHHSSVESLRHIWIFVTPWTATRQASLSITNSRSLSKLKSIESVMPSNHLILCHPLLLPRSIFPSIRVFSDESVLCIWWPKYRNFSLSISPFNEHPGLISFRMDWLNLLAVQGTLKSLLQHHSSKASILWCSAFCMIQLSHPYMTTGKNIALNSSHWLANCGGQDRICIPTTRKKIKALATRSTL